MDVPLPLIAEAIALIIPTLKNALLSLALGPLERMK